MPTASLDSLVHQADELLVLGPHVCPTDVTPALPGVAELHVVTAVRDDVRQVYNIDRMLSVHAFYQTGILSQLEVEVI